MWEWLYQLACVAFLMFAVVVLFRIDPNEENDEQIFDSSEEVVEAEERKR